jgi:hypothetical protein
MDTILCVPYFLGKSLGRLAGRREVERIETMCQMPSIVSVLTDLGSDCLTRSFSNIASTAYCNRNQHSIINSP